MAREKKRQKRVELASAWKRNAVLLGLMVVLAVVGMGVTQASETGAWEYWLFALSVYMVIGITRTSLGAWRSEAPMVPKILATLAHWTCPLMVVGALVYLERLGLISRESAAVSALLLLSLSCVTAGVHLDVIFLPLGVVLTVMAVAVMLFEESMLILWLSVVGVAAAAMLVYYFVGRARAAQSAGLD